MKKTQIAKEVVNTLIKNSEIVQPYVKPSHYRRGLFVLNVINFILGKKTKGGEK